MSKVSKPFLPDIFDNRIVRDDGRVADGRKEESVEEDDDEDDD